VPKAREVPVRAGSIAAWDPGRKPVVGCARERRAGWRAARRARRVGAL